MSGPPCQKEGMEAVADLKVVAGKGTRHAHAFQLDVGAVRHTPPAVPSRCSYIEVHVRESCCSVACCGACPLLAPGAKQPTRTNRCDCAEPWAGMILDEASCTWPQL